MQSSDNRSSAARSGAVVELRSPSQADAKPIRKTFGQPQVVIREHTNNAVRWKQGERLNHLLEEACVRFSGSEAVIPDTETLSYRELDCRANQVARYLIDQGIQAGDRVGLL